MPHVAVVNRHPSDAVGGSELQCDLFARGLVGRGHTVTYVALHAEGADADAAATPYHLVRLGARASRDPGAIARAVRGAGADVVYWRYGREQLDGVVARLARSPRPIPVVLAVAHVDDVSRWPTGPIPRSGARDLAADLRRRVAHRRSWRAFRAGAQVAAVAAQRADFVGRVPVALERHVPNVVDPTVVPFSWPRPYVAWVANLKARKRPEQLTPLAHALAPHGVDLVVAGAVQDERYRPLSAPDPAVANLHPLGPLAPARAAGLIAGARCLAVTSRPEGLSNAMIQAWWHGVPTVSLDYDPDGAIAEHGLGAVCAGDEDAFRAATVAQVTDVALRDAAGARARAYARARFALDENVALLEALLEETVERANLRRSVDG
jgi:glycosyltransferase involved in cell wall biosynthesis